MPVKKKTKKKTAKRKPTAGALPTKPSMKAYGPEDYIMCFFGPPGVGKTTFVNSLGDTVLFLSTDRGTRFLDAMRQECNKWEDFLKVLTKLESAYSAGKKPYDYIAIDHVADWAAAAEKYACTKLDVTSLADLPFGKGWSVFKKTMHDFLQRLRALDVGIIFISHEVTKTVKVSGLDVDKVMPDMPNSAYKLLIPLADLVGYISMKPYKPKGGKRTEIRILETEPRRDLYAKDRTRRTPPAKGWEKLDGQAFINSF